jgi:hypothetical protein
MANSLGVALWTPLTTCKHCVFNNLGSGPSRFDVRLELDGGVLWQLFDYDRSDSTKASEYGRTVPKHHAKSGCAGGNHSTVKCSSPVAADRATLHTQLISMGSTGSVLIQE